MNIEKFSKLYDKYYKLSFYLVVFFLIIVLFYLYSFSQIHGDIIRKDISLTGGTSVQINSNLNVVELNKAISEKFPDSSIRQISDLFTGKQIAVVIETSAPSNEIVPFLEDYLGYELTDENSSIEFTGSSLSDSFYNQLRFAIILSFVFMSIVVFLIFRIPIPSFAVIFAAFSDIVMTIAVVNLLGITFSTAGIVAIIMLIGYSVDTDILLTTRVLKRKEGSINERIFGAFKTGITMTLTALAVVLVGLIMTASISKVFSQIFTVLAIGLVFDILTTWLANASSVKWYAEKYNLN